MERHMLCNAARSRRMQSTAVHFEAAIMYDNEISDSQHYDIPCVSVLMDTGALCANYVSINIFEEIKHNLAIGDVLQVKTRIGLADNATILQSDKTINLNLMIHSKDGAKQPYSGKFIVIPMKDNEIIIGLPAIISTL